MSQERFFRLLSIALLGAVALAFVPEKSHSVETASVSTLELAPPQVEVNALHEVESINSGHYIPYAAGDVSPSIGVEASAEPVDMTN